MTWDMILKVSAAVIVSFGGTSAIIIGVIKFVADKIADKLEKNMSLN